MKIEKHAKDLKGNEVNIITSGGGKFDGYAGSYDSESNTISVWNGFQRTRIDADKIVSVKRQSPIWVILAILAFIYGCFVLLSTTDPSSRGYRGYDNYKTYDSQRTRGRSFWDYYYYDRSW